jgi:broad-specificity NMP kinase
MKIYQSLLQNTFLKEILLFQSSSYIVDTDQKTTEEVAEEIIQIALRSSVKTNPNHLLT